MVKKASKVAAPAAAADAAPPAKKLKRKRKLDAAAADGNDELVAAETDMSVKKQRVGRDAVPNSAGGKPLVKKLVADSKVADLDSADNKPLSRASKKAVKKKLAKQQAATLESSVVAPGSKPAPSTLGEPATQAVATGENTIFVDGVPYVWTKEKIVDFFKACGVVKDVRAPTWQDSGRLRGYAHVTFADRVAQKKALAMDGVEAGKKGRFLKIEAAKESNLELTTAPSVDIEGKRRLFVKNLPYDATEAEIGDLFRAFGKILEVRVPTSFGRSKGFAYVEFARSEFLKAAVDARPPPSIRGRTLRLDVDVGQGPKAGFHARAEAFGSGFGPDHKPKFQPKGTHGGKSGGKGRGAGRREGKVGGQLSLF